MQCKNPWFLSVLSVFTLCAAACSDKLGDDPGQGSGASAGAGAGRAGDGPAGAAGRAGGAGGSGGSSSGGGGKAGGASGSSAGIAGAGGAAAGTSGGSAGSSSGAGGSAGNGSAGAGAGGTGASGAAGAGGTGSGGEAGVGGSGGEAGLGGEGGSAGSGGMGGSGGTVSAPPVGKKFVGNIDTRGQIRSDFVEYWNQFSPENAGKWDSIERTRDEMNWTQLDRMYEYARAHNIIFKQHTLLWGRQQPGWLNNLSQSEQREEVEEWIRLYCERYPDTELIDVVNEPPPHTTPPYVAALGGSGSSGYDWIAQAFKWARQYCPNSILILNDYNNIEYQSDNAHTIDIAKRIKAAGAPIDAVGAQAHDAYKMSTGTVQMYIDRIANETGLPVYITEYDIDIADDNQQKNVMESQFTMFWNNQNVAGITIWGYIVGSTWKANTGLKNSNGNPRPALTWLENFLGL